jgi:uncharacterized repeat protein (TIGR01451 family)
MTIEIANSITPTFTQAGPFCRGANIPALPVTSTNGITGTWAPAINNTATTTYTFTPAAGQCASTTTLTIQITTLITPVFNQIGPLLLNSNPPALPLSSVNSITGTWTPSAINTSISGMQSYLFTPAAGQCATTATMNIGIEAPSITISKVQASGPNPVTAAGQVIGYLIDLENTGNVNITGINITEIYPGTGTGSLGAPVESVSTNGVLNPGERWRYTASYTVNQADIDAGNNLVNTARVVTLQVPGPLTASATTRVTGTASLAITKVASETTYSAAGNVLHYTITVRNNGNITLNNISVTDPLTGMNQLIANLGPGAIRTFNTTYTTFLIFIY